MLAVEFLLVGILGAAIGCSSRGRSARRRDRRRRRDRGRRDRVVDRGAGHDLADPRRRGDTRAGPGAAQRDRGAVHRDRAAEAEGLHRRRPRAERVRVRPVAEEGRRRGHERAAEPHVAARARRRARARAVARPEPRRPGDHARGHDRRRARRRRRDLRPRLVLRRLGRRRQRRRRARVDRRRGPRRDPGVRRAHAVVRDLAPPRGAGRHQRGRARVADGLRKALEKLEADHTVLHHVSRATAHLWLETPLDDGRQQAARKSSTGCSTRTRRSPSASRSCASSKASTPTSAARSTRRSPACRSTSPSSRRRPTAVPAHGSGGAAARIARDRRRARRLAHDRRGRSRRWRSARRPPATHPAGTTPDAQTLRYWDGNGWLTWTATWNGHRWVQHRPA